MKRFGTTAQLAQAILKTGQLVGILGDQIEGDKVIASYYIVAPKIPDVNDVTLANGNIAEYQGGTDAFIPIVPGIESIEDILKIIYPVGCTYTHTVDSTNPFNLFGFGTWVKFGEGRVIVNHKASDSDFDTPGLEGGAKTRVITESQMPAHTHTMVDDGTHIEANNSTYTGSRNGNGGYSGGQNITNITQTQVTGGSQPFNVIQPFIVAYVWNRIV